MPFRAKGQDIGAPILVFAGTGHHQKMSPGILGFGFERLVLDPLFGGWAFPAIGKPVLENHGAQLLDLHARDHDLSIGGMLAQTNDNSAHDQSHNGKYKHDLNHCETRRLAPDNHLQLCLSHAVDQFRKRASYADGGISGRSPHADLVAMGSFGLLAQSLKPDAPIWHLQYRSQFCAQFKLRVALNKCIVVSMITVEELGQEIAELAVHLDAATHRLLECVRQFDAECGWAAQGAVSCAHWLSWRLGLDPATAREKVRVARALGNLPTIDAALMSGKVSYAKVRALTRVATAQSEAKLLEAALYSTGAQLERLCRGYRTAMTVDNVLPPPERGVRRRDLPGGMVKLEVVLSPDEADLILRALERAREVTPAPARDASAETSAEEPAPEDPKHPSRADGMVALAESYLASNTGAGNYGERFQVMVHMDQDPLAPDGVLSGTLDDGTRVSAETLRRVACDCRIVTALPSPSPATQGEATALQPSPRPESLGEVAPLESSPRPTKWGEVDARSAEGEGQIGRRTRTISPSLRRALTLRDHGCTFPGCTHDRFLQGHHIHHWLHGGATTMDNLALLCTHHHRLVHEGGWSVERMADGELRFRAPDGKEVPAVPASEASDDAVVWVREWAEERSLDIGAETNVPLWDGTRPDYDWAVGMLVGEAGV